MFIAGLYTGGSVESPFQQNYSHDNHIEVSTCGEAVGAAVEQTISMIIVISVYGHSYQLPL